MIDIKAIRENPALFKEASAKKRITVDIDRLLTLDNELKGVKTRLQDIATEKNKAGKDIAKLQGDAKAAALAEMTKLKQEESGLNEKVNSSNPSLTISSFTSPCRPHPKCPKARTIPKTSRYAAGAQ